jgi:Flp pilus assembly protein TadD
MADRLLQLQTMLERDPSDAFCTYALALEHAKRGECEQAVHWFDRTLQLDANQCYAYFHKARALAQDGRVSEARDALRCGLAQARRGGDLKAASEIEALLDELTQ